MHRRFQLPDQLSDLARIQGGILTAKQLSSAGVPVGALRRLRQQWTPLAPGIFSLASPSWLGLAQAGIARTSGSGILGDRAAAFLGGAIRDEPTTISVWVPPGMRLRSIRADEYRVVFRQAVRSSIGDPPRTALAQALVDLAGIANENELVAAATRAFARRLILPQHLVQAIDARIRMRHRRLLTELCSEASEGIESVLEWRFATAVLRRHNLPTATHQAKLAAGRADLVFDDYAVIVELDGRRDHLDWSKDMFRDNEHLIAHAALTFRYDWRATVYEPCQVAEQLGRALRTKGWTGTVRHGRSCIASKDHANWK